ncbi:MAG TPA: hypothetical protein PLM98_18165, partial [Thiolinea sp.]|nr:hypothetical protein [Thiolinea sp.]
MTVFRANTTSYCWTFDNVLWYSTQTELRNYNLATNTDTLKRSLTHAYGDIAWAADGKLYGIEYLSFTNPAPQTFASVQNANPTLYRLYQIDPVAGTETLIYSGNDIAYGNSLSSDNKNWLYFGSGLRQGGTGPFTTGKAQM